MKVTPPRILMFAVVGAALGLAAAYGFGLAPWLRGATGQQALQALAEATAPAPPADVVPARVGDPMPAIALPGLDGATHRLPDDYPGTPLLINVWASWCGPCIEEMPELARFDATRPRHGVQVIGLALDTAEGVRDFLERVPVDYPILLETPGPADTSVWLGNVRGLLPYTVLVDAQGRIARQKLGPFAHDEIEGWATSE